MMKEFSDFSPGWLISLHDSWNSPPPNILILFLAGNVAYVGFEVIKVVVMNVAIFWDIVPSSLYVDAKFLLD
jgi:hypothetical protein